MGPIFGWIIGAAAYAAFDTIMGALYDYYTTSPEERMAQGKLDLVREARALENYRAKAVAQGLAAEEADAKYFANLVGSIGTSIESAGRGLVRRAGAGGGRPVMATEPQPVLDPQDPVDPMTGMRPMDTMRNVQNPPQAALGIQRSLTELLGPQPEEAKMARLASSLLTEDRWA